MGPIGVVFEGKGAVEDDAGTGEDIVGEVDVGVATVGACVEGVTAADVLQPAIITVHAIRITRETRNLFI